MLCVEDWWTLVCYAGPASEASIDSKPIGSELENQIGTGAGESQLFVETSADRMIGSQLDPHLRTAPRRGDRQ